MSTNAKSAANRLPEGLVTWRVGIGVLYALGQAAVSALVYPSTDNDPWVTITLVGVPVAIGALVGRWWVVAFACWPLLAYAIDSDTGELAPWFPVAVGVVATGICLALGVGARKGVERALGRRRRDPPARRSRS